MSHCIHTIIFPEKELKDKNLPHVSLKSGGLVMMTESNAHLITWDMFPEYIEVNTDYFGGIGEQSCIYYKRGEFPKNLQSINEGLILLGVKKESGMDEFDTVGLGNYRSNEDITPERAKRAKEITFDPFEDAPKFSIIEVLGKIKDGLYYSSIPCSKIQAEKTDNGFLCYVHVENFKTFNPFDLDEFALGSDIPRKDIHLPELIRLEEGKEFIKNDKYFTVKF